MEETNEVLTEHDKKSVWNSVTPFSKYAAMVLFVVMPFVGGWIGYTYAPEKAVEVEKVVVKEIPVEVAAREKGYEYVRSGQYIDGGHFFLQTQIDWDDRRNNKQRLLFVDNESGTTTVVENVNALLATEKYGPNRYLHDLEILHAVDRDTIYFTRTYFDSLAGYLIERLDVENMKMERVTVPTSAEDKRVRLPYGFSPDGAYLMMDNATGSFFVFSVVEQKILANIAPDAGNTFVQSGQSAGPDVISIKWIDKDTFTASEYKIRGEYEKSVSGAPVGTEAVKEVKIHLPSLEYAAN